MLYSVSDESLAKLAEENKLKAQKVKDKQGRERFHGAFTGGFSAGYYNTVSTPEGSNSLWLHLNHLYLQHSYSVEITGLTVVVKNGVCKNYAFNLRYQ